MAKKDVLQPVDDDARRLAGQLIRTARYGALATLDPVSGGPVASRVILATAMDGRPVFLISRLSAHFCAMEADARASLLLGEPADGDPLAHPRITLKGKAEMLGGDDRDRCRSRFLLRHPKAEIYVDFADFAFWALHPQSASLNGGFAKAFELSAADLTLSPSPELEAEEASLVANLNERHSGAIALCATRLLNAPAGNWRVAGLDPAGLDLCRGDSCLRLWFDKPLAQAADLPPRLAHLAETARRVAGDGCADV